MGAHYRVVRMKVLLFSGTHPRHLYVHTAILAAFDVCGAVCMSREEMIPKPPASASDRDKALFVRHFRDRLDAEKRYFGERDARRVFSGVPVHECGVSDINSSATAEFISSCAPDVVFIFGTTLIKEPVMSSLPQDRLNLHLGLSPWYRGAATLFWPFYNLQPQFAGSTLHQILPRADAGAIIHQSVPFLERGDGIHDVACKTIMQSTADLIPILKERSQRGNFLETPQRSSGRLYLQKDFRPEHLRVIYELFNNDIVDAYLRGELQKEDPQIVSALQA